MEGQGSQQFTINVVSTLHLNQEALGSINENNAVQITDPFAIPNNGAPTTQTRSPTAGPTRPLVLVNGHFSATPFQDLLAEAIAAGRTPPRPQGGSSRVQPQIDLNQAAESDDPNPFSSGSSNASPLVISSGASGYVLEEGQGGDNGRRLSCKRRATEEPGESSRLVDGTPVIHIEDNDEEPEQQPQLEEQEDDIDIDDDVNVDGGDYFEEGYEAPFVLDGNLANSYEQQLQYVARPVVLGLAAPTQMEREVQFLRDRIFARSRQIGQHIPEYQQAMAQRDSTFGLQAPQPAYFPYASAPGGFHPMAPPPSHQPISNPYIPDFGEPGEPFWTQINRQVVWPGVPHVPVAPVNFNTSNLEANGNLTSTVVHYGFQIPDGALTSVEALTRAHYCPHYPGYPIDPRMMNAGMRGWFAGTHQSIGPRISRPRVSVQINSEIAIRAAAHARRRQNIRAAMERIRANQANRNNDNQEAAMVMDPAARTGDNEVQPVNEDHGMDMNVEDMSYLALIALEERLGRVTSRVIDCSLKPYKYGSAASSSSSTNDQCCICQDEYNVGEDVTTLKCGHVFHFACIKTWLMQKNNCPICKRAALPGPSD